MNHSRKNDNCRMKALMVGDTARLMLVTTKPIKPGEELLYDYGERRKEVLEEFPWLRE